jgi:hypothetical protein
MFAAGPDVVYKHGGRTNENIVLHYYSVPKKHAAFESNAIAQTDFALDKRMIANIAVLAYNCSFDHMGEGPNTRAGAYTRAFIDQSIGVNKNCCIYPIHGYLRFIRRYYD